MPNAGVLIFVSVVGAVICAKTRVPAGAVVFSLVELTLFVSTPVGAGLPGAVSRFLSAVNEATTPALTHDRPASGGSGAVG
jgi:hypothetical protein